MKRDIATAEGNAVALVGIYEISKILGATLDLERALRDVLNVLSSYLSMHHGVVIIAADADDEPELAVSVGFPQDSAALLPHRALKKVISTGMAVVVADAADEPILADYAGAGEVLEDETVSFLCVPVKATERTLGALAVQRTSGPADRQRFEHDVRFLNMVATMIGQAVALHRRIAADRRHLLEQNARVAKMADLRPVVPVQGLEDIIGGSPAMRDVFAQVQQAAPAKVTVLLRGESGTGKEMVARAIHILSPRAKKPFVKVNCAALSETLLESELFGHERGAFTGATQERKGRFELAHGGTLFLDEIGEISAAFQAKLLRVLQEGEFERVGGTRTLKVDVRLVAATNRNLEEAVSKGDFRADLYYRINVVPIRLPALRERPSDIPLLAAHFLGRFNAENGSGLAFADDALKALQRCFFPGNVRELENCVCRTATMVRGEVIRDSDLFCHKEACLSSALWYRGGKPPVPAAPPAPPPPPEPAAPPPAEQSDAAPGNAALSERDTLVAAMEKAGWVQAKAARLLGLTPRQIGYALKKHGVEVRQF
ncbi:MAG: nif-specific transcriptional activator NifA [Magnetospirillum sp.]|nr:nif-specific transcriptional activator NifA [Magnetospirillum sp.]